MRDRLIEILKKFCTDDCKITHQCGYCDFGDLTVCPSAVAEHLLANGVIVPPCKVGDTVYYRPYGSNRVYEGKVTSFIYNSESRRFGINYDGGYGTYGKYVFLTREEAEQALKGGAE